MLFTDGMMSWPPDPDAWSLRWYRYMIGDCTDKYLTTPCGNKWMIGTVNSFFVGTVSTLIATSNVLYSCKCVLTFSMLYL
jgi:ABC-type spermidine/putrescine transport system permease subunit II